MQAAQTVEIALDDPNDAAQLTPWQMDYRQIEAGRLRTHLKVVANVTVSVTDITLSHAVHQRGVPPPRTLTFGRVRNQHSYRWHGRELTSPRLLSFGTGNGYESVSLGGFSGKVISLDIDFMQKNAELSGLEIPDAIHSADKFEALGSDAEFHNVDSLLATFLNDATLLNDADACETLAREFLLAATNSEAHEDKSALHLRRKALRRAVGVMEQFAREPLSIGEICKFANCSWRTLDRVFKEEFGLGPKAYFVRLRLEQVRKELLVSDPTFSVIDAANGWGFWHMGQFASDYKKMYGELPSMTLRRVPKLNWQSSS